MPLNATTRSRTSLGASRSGRRSPRRSADRPRAVAVTRRSGKVLAKEHYTVQAAFKSGSKLAGTTERSYAPGAFICMKGEPVEFWMGIIDGLGKMASH